MPMRFCRSASAISVTANPLSRIEPVVVSYRRKISPVVSKRDVVKLHAQLTVGQAGPPFIENLVGYRVEIVDSLDAAACLLQVLNLVCDLAQRAENRIDVSDDQVRCADADQLLGEQQITSYERDDTPQFIQANPQFDQERFHQARLAMFAQPLLVVPVQVVHDVIASAGGANILSAG